MDIDAVNHIDAAQQCEDILQDPDSCARVFDVTPMPESTVVVDLDEVDLDHTIAMAKQERDMNIIDAIIEFENGSLSRIKTIELFQIMVNTGQVWKLQGAYGKQAQAFIDQGLVTAKE
jgi:hypothetical protein